ncbi:hypothetical protein [Burkholderia sp. BE17]|uniref:hypothetical protein n=1 Tax=Burkholderia sp. BE17 TaxID=2656644 RepID=UPI00128E269B|nr:hypothetical protein [Burkholderia sp. BE17]MPV68635.1 hypothetical protein [Burkholderia sp. BE17]
MEFKAFADDSTVVNIAGDAFTVVNDPRCVVLSGTLEIGRDKTGLAAARMLQQAIESILNVLEQDSKLPTHARKDPAEPTGKVANPFEG